ncbi:molybdopterin-guanine dinucleotide biosynthesis protein B [Methanohalobium evestigatum Z-7303]|uniref:Molybdopterin-guanine dinucleotide biosynthesis protein B n=1 Tax=Methanohalobium evestigatum (strain ATCC BAA-1072 / DSM 3721 / NBRC 107634 / OCM 161 / Z-7303) TaxID=644295 RepID=D7EAY2_METEZ|nr:molybdopterin synthase [Methanohalobium evestigatum]ADI74499.1 molybdopterin-guanine dinucleotide biosynthesis protein B [Methanohalobium evestigatum Z-7303]
MKVISIIGHKKTGKTTLVSRLTKQLSRTGKVGTVKSMIYHRFNPDDTDTSRHFDSGADMVTALTKDEFVTISKNPDIEKALDTLADNGMDYAIVEGDKNSDLPKILLGDMDDDRHIKNVVEQVPDVSHINTDKIIEIICSQPDWVTLDLLVKKVKNNPEIKKAGAIGTFTGVVREITSEVQTKMLEFEKYETVAEDKINQISVELKQKPGIVDVLIHHKSGRVNPGEDIVYIVVVASHRTELFQTLSEAIERVKSEVPIWKKEITIDGNYWVHDHG